MRYVIAGNGAAGVEAALSIRKNDPHGEIEIISSAGEPHYYRPRLVEYLAGEIPFQRFMLYSEKFYESRMISNRLNTRIEMIDIAGKRIIDDRNNSIPYNRLLLATGARSFIPPVEGAGKTGVFALRELPDADRILNYISGRKEIVVMGGGLLGLETAHSLSKIGKNVTVIEFAPYLLPRQLDSEGAELLQKLLEKKGLKFILNDSVSSITGDVEVKELTLASGKNVPAEAVVFSIGVRSNADLAKKAGIAVHNGITVNSFMETSVKDIYAAGDAAEHNGITYGMWSPAKEQGAAAGLNMCGIPTEYRGSEISAVLKITGIDLFSAGDISGKDTKSLSLKTDSAYIKFFKNKDQPAGVIIIGKGDLIKTAQSVMKGQEKSHTLEEIIRKGKI
jgi:nitrite reductase (NADH) large subunit